MSKPTCHALCERRGYPMCQRSLELVNVKDVLNQIHRAHEAAVAGDYAEARTQLLQCIESVETARRAAHQSR